MTEHDRRLTAKDFSPELLELYDFYAHGIITKREFLDRAGKFAIGGLTAAAIFSLMSPDYALAEQVSFNDPDIKAEWITYPSPNGHGEMRAYFVRPTTMEMAMAVSWTAMTRTAPSARKTAMATAGRAAMATAMTPIR